MHPTILLFILLTLASQPPAKDTVKGSIQHSRGESMSRITGKVKIIDGSTLEFSDGTRVAPDPASRANARPESNRVGLPIQSVLFLMWSWADKLTATFGHTK